MATSQKDKQRRVNGWYVYGIVPSDVEVVEGANGITDAPVEVVRSGDIAALVSRVNLDRPLGTKSDVVSHKEILDSVAMAAPVLPVRFGSVVASRTGVVKELLEPHHDEFGGALRELTGKIQFVIRARYVEPPIIREILDANPAAAQLREQIGGDTSEATRDLQLRLGELIYKAIEAKRTADCGVVMEAVSKVTDTTSLREPSHELDAAHMAVLVDARQGSELEKVLNDVAGQWNGRANVSLFGPEAPYDFVVTMRS